MQQIGLDATINNVPDFTHGIDTMNKSVGNFAEEAGQSVKVATQGVDAAGKAIENTVADVGAAAAKAANLTQDAAGRWRNATGRFASDAELAAAGVTKIIPAAKGAGDAAKKAGDDAEKGGRGFDAFGEIVTGALRVIGELAVTAMAKAGQAVAGFLKDSIGLAGDFEANMLQFQSVAGKDVDTAGLKAFRDLFLDIGKRLPVSTSEVQQAAIEMVKGGIDPATIAAGGLEQTIQFAAAAMGGDLVKAAEISSKILGGWTSSSATAAEKAAFLTHSTDLLTKAANASSTDVEGLSLGIFNAQGIAKTAGVSFDDLTTTLAELAPRFASSSEAGTSLKNLISRLQPTTKDATAAMEGLGLITEDGKNKFYDASGAFVGFQSASQLLQDSLGGLTQQQQASVLQTIFGNDAMSAASALAELGAQGYASMADALNNANGVAAAAALKQKGYNAALSNAQGSVEALRLTIVTALLPVLTDLLNNVIAPAINAFTDWADAIFSADDPIAALVDQIDHFSPILGTVVAAIADFVQSGGDLGVVADDLNEGVSGLGDAFLTVVAIAGTVVGGIQELVAWFTTAGDSSSGLGGALDDLNGVWNQALKTVTDVGQGYMAIAQAVLPIVQGLWLAHGAEISAFVKTTYDSVIQIVTLALQLYDAIVPPILTAVAGFIETHGSEIQRILKGAWDMVTSIITGALETIKGVLKLALDLIHGDWDAAWKDVEHIVNVQVAAIEGFVSGFFDAIAGIFDTSMAEIGQLWQHNWDMLVDIATNTDWAAVGESVVSGIRQGISDAWSSLTNWLEQKLEDLWNAGLKKIGAASPATEWMPVGEFSVLGIMEGFASMWPSLETQLDQLGDDIVSKARSIVDAVQSAIADAQAAAAELQIGGFLSEANIARQKVKNIKDLGKLPEATRAGLESQLVIAEQIAATINDPKQAAEYFRARSAQLFDLANIQAQLSQDIDDGERAQLESRLKLWQDGMAEIDAMEKRGEQLPKMQAELKSWQDKMAEINALQESGAISAEAADAKRLQIAEHIAETTAKINAIQTAGILSAADADAQRAQNAKRIAEIQTQLAGDLTDQQRRDLQMQYDLVNAANLAEDKARAAEIAQQEALKASQPTTSPTDALWKTFHDIRAALDKIEADPKDPLHDTLAALGDPLIGLYNLLVQLSGAQHRLTGGPVEAGTPYWVGERGRELFTPNGNGMVSPHMSAGQLMSGGGATYNGQVGNTTNLNMPIYTNQSPTVLQSSMAIAGASLL